MQPRKGGFRGVAANFTWLVCYLLSTGQQDESQWRATLPVHTFCRIGAALYFMFFMFLLTVQISSDWEEGGEGLSSYV